MTEPHLEPPHGEEMQALLTAAKENVMSQVSRSRSSKRRRRGRIFGTVAVGAVALGGITTAAATGLLGGVEATSSATADFDLGAAPAGSTFVYVTVDVTCKPSAKYEIELDHSRNPASLTCGKRDGGKPSQLGYEFELEKKGPNHSVTVTTNVERKYKVRADYRTGLTQNQRLNLEMKAKEAERAENARTVKRTNKVPSSDPYNHPAAWPDPYYVNENGMTIGTFDRDTTPYEQWPDLVPTEGPDGEHAFTYSGMRGLVVKNPGEAVAYMKWLESSGQMDRVKSGRWAKSYTLYLAQDGKTVLAKKESGSFKQE